MSSYGINKAGWLVVHDPGFRAEILDNPELALNRVDLDDDERAMLLAGDVAGLYRRGAHEFLLFNLARAGALGLSVPVFVQRIRTAAEPVTIAADAG